jgi:hypothetical protein
MPIQQVDQLARSTRGDAERSLAAELGFPLNQEA